MRTIKVLITVLATAIVTISSAVEKSKMNLIPLSTERAIVSIKMEKPAHFELSVKADNGEIVYYKKTDETVTDYQKVFDFGNLENGNYTLNLKFNNKNLSRNFEVLNNGINVGESELRIDPYFSYDDNTFKFTYLNFDEASFNLKIYNDRELIYKKSIGKDFTLSSGFDLSKLEAGNYKVVLSSHLNQFVYNLEK